ncbi:TY-Chap domain-containing protein [Nocardia sp. NBC_01329]|uniref:TY-Chap domain-containing protein n=1 Tax=Nocardia sp. NBC_01329 TaxID=2903594 RepID=UPI003FA349FE
MRDPAAAVFHVSSELQGRHCTRHTYDTVACDTGRGSSEEGEHDHVVGLRRRVSRNSRDTSLRCGRYHRRAGTTSDRARFAQFCWYGKGIHAEIAGGQQLAQPSIDRTRIITDAGWRSPGPDGDENWWTTALARDLRRLPAPGFDDRDRVTRCPRYSETR